MALTRRPADWGRKKEMIMKGRRERVEEEGEMNEVEGENGEG